MTPDWLLTAAHCIERAAGRPIEAVFGDYDQDLPEQGEQWFLIADTVVHPSFNSVPDSLVSDHDLALARLDHAASVDTEVSPLWMAVTGSIESVWLMGWGSTGDGQMAPSQQHAVCAAVAPEDSCAGHLAQLGAAGRDLLCVGGAMGSPGACHKDSGGMAIAAGSNGVWQLAGVVVAGGPRCDEYTLIEPIESFIPWIAQYVPT